MTDPQTIAEGMTTGERPAYLLVKRGLYYRPDNCGYTGIKDNAGRYHKSEADRRSGVAAIHEDCAPMFSKGCWEDVKVEHLLGLLAERDAELATLRTHLEKESKK